MVEKKVVFEFFQDVLEEFNKICESSNISVIIIFIQFNLENSNSSSELNFFQSEFVKVVDDFENGEREFYIFVFIQEEIVGDFKLEKFNGELSEFFGVGKGVFGLI